mmetsp:Transcript_41185/g.74238  ORF Transcript_41185/g.74238 Transcript_41185/m.74238 type:complete len:326 (-) Transcript_41185:1125-2102(-)
MVLVRLVFLFLRLFLPCDQSISLSDASYHISVVIYIIETGGVLDIFYPDWKMKITTNETLFRMTCQLWKEAYCHTGESLEDLTNASSEVDGSKTTVENCDGDDSANKRKDDSFKWHPFGAFDHDKGYTFIDRIGYRIPTKIAESIGKQLTMTKDMSQPTQAPSNAKKITPKKKKPKSRAIQRSLTPHFDCCPEKYHDTTNKNKWRPIQCFVSLTDNLQPNTGGFEAVPGFHREFRSWVDDGRRFGRLSGDDEPLPESKSQTPHPQRCVGEYTHLSPSEDRALMQRVQHIPVMAGSEYIQSCFVPIFIKDKLSGCRFRVLFWWKRL